MEYLLFFNTINGATNGDKQLATDCMNCERSIRNMLFENEKIGSWDDGFEEAVLTDEQIEEKYAKGEVRIVTEQARYPLNTIKGLVESSDYELNPDFQRRHRWDYEKKSKLIESFIINVPIPPIFLYENEYSHYEVMDGLQRLTAIEEFYSDKYALIGLQQWSELNGRKYSQLPEKIRKGIDRRYISSIILLQETAKTIEKAAEIKQLVFQRINSGGVKLEPQESRNALLDGPMNHLCLQLSSNTYLRKLLLIDESDLEGNKLYSAMTDVEYVLRFFAMRQLEGYTKRKLQDYFDYYLSKANGYDSVLLERLGNLFKNTIKLAFDIFGEQAFFMFRAREVNGITNWNWYQRATTTIYDPMMQVLSSLVDYSDQLIEQKERIKTDIMDFYKSNYEDFEGRNNNKADIEKRISLIKEFFERYISR